MTVIATISYILFILLLTFAKGSVTLTISGRERPVRSQLGRALVGVLAWPFIGLVFWLFGLISKFLLSPFTYLFGG